MARSLRMGQPCPRDGFKPAGGAPASWCWGLHGAQGSFLAPIRRSQLPRCRTLRSGSPPTAGLRCVSDSTASRSTACVSSGSSRRLTSGAAGQERPAPQVSTSCGACSTSRTLIEPQQHRRRAAAGQAWSSSTASNNTGCGSAACRWIMLTSMGDHTSTAQPGDSPRRFTLRAHVDRGGREAARPSISTWARRAADAARRRSSRQRNPPRSVALPRLQPEQRNRLASPHRSNTHTSLAPHHWDP